MNVGTDRNDRDPALIVVGCTTIFWYKETRNHYLWLRRSSGVHDSVSEANKASLILSQLRGHTPCAIINPYSVCRRGGAVFSLFLSFRMTPAHPNHGLVGMGRSHSIYTVRPIPLALADAENCYYVKAWYGRCTNLSWLEPYT